MGVLPIKNHGRDARATDWQFSARTQACHNVASNRARRGFNRRVVDITDHVRGVVFDRCFNPRPGGG